MISRARIYKHRVTKMWTVDVWMSPVLLNMMQSGWIWVLKDGTQVVRFSYNSWAEAHDLLFGGAS